MKKYFVFLFSCLIITLSSCTKDAQNTEMPVLEDVAVESLKADLTSLNETMFGESFIVTKAKWWKFLVTALVDAGAGLLTSNVSIGISASSLTWTILKDVCAVKQNETSFNPSSIALTELKLGNDGETLLSDGEIHNIVLMNLNEKYGEDMFELPEETLIREVANEVAELKGCSLEEAIADIDEASSQIKIFTDAYINSSSIEEYTTTLKKYYPQNATEIDVLEITFEGFQQVDVDTDNGEYAREVTRIIDESAIPTTMKNDLKLGVSIANASTRLWNKDAIVIEE